MNLLVNVRKLNSIISTNIRCQKQMTKYLKLKKIIEKYIRKKRSSKNAIPGILFDIS